MAKHVDKATGSSVAIDLYKRFYRPTSSLAVHAGAQSLLRHVRGDGRLSRGPGRVWTRRSPARIADACLGILTAVIAQQVGVPYERAIRYADRHADRALTPVVVMSSEGFKQALRPQKLVTTVMRLRRYGDYIWSGKDAEDPDARRAQIRAYMEALLFAVEPDIPAGSLDPFLDYVAAKIAAETAPTAA